jgi:hypothetical protein
LWPFKLISHAWICHFNFFLVILICFVGFCQIEFDTCFGLLIFWNLEFHDFLLRLSFQNFLTFFFLPCFSCVSNGIV